MWEVGGHPDRNFSRAARPFEYEGYWYKEVTTIKASRVLEGRGMSEGW